MGNVMTTSASTTAPSSYNHITAQHNSSAVFNVRGDGLVSALAVPSSAVQASHTSSRRGNDDTAYLGGYPHIGRGSFPSDINITPFPCQIQSGFPSLHAPLFPCAAMPIANTITRPCLRRDPTRRRHRTEVLCTGKSRFSVGTHAKLLSSSVPSGQRPPDALKPTATIPCAHFGHGTLSRVDDGGSGPNHRLGRREDLLRRP